MYLIELYRDIKVWYKYAKVTKAKSNQERLNDKGLRTDWLGRLYTVINIPEEMVNYPNIEMWVMQQLSPFNEVLIELGIADYSYPEVQKIDEEGVNAYLVVMYPELNNISISRFIIEVVKWVAIGFGLKIGYRFCAEHQVFETIKQFLSHYV